MGVLPKADPVKRGRRELINRILATVARSAKDSAGKPLLSGLIQRIARTWTYHAMREYAEQGAGFNVLFREKPQWVARLAQLHRDFQSIRETSLPEFLEWVRKANAPLFEEIVADPKIMAWLRNLWQNERPKFWLG